MSMHLLGPWYTTTRYRSNSSTPRSSEKSDEHQKWLTKRGLNSKQISQKKTTDNSWKREYVESMKVDRSKYVSAGMSGNASSCADRSLMSNLHKEPEHVRKAILEKAKRIAPLYSKGAYQYITPESDAKDIGRKK